MPNNEYQCDSCGGRFEVIQKFSDPALTTCRLCNARTVRKVLSPPAFVLKGTGWYATDYAAKDRKREAAPDKPAGESKPATSCSSGCCTGPSCPSKG